ncbi:MULTISPECIES: HNH endonuclease [Luteimonas]|uniref:HNH endonuclease n=1 Tax=Luteimonas TaxID=83614 RepID=UPI000C7CC816|nr:MULTISPECIES: HNH endonuclease [Luteimonas]
MRAALRRRLLLAAQTDALATLADGIWTTRCLHCRSALQVRDDGEPLGLATLEHVVPRAWFGKRAAAGLCARIGGDPDDARNLALACARCNHGKGTRHDGHGPADPRARQVVTGLLDLRLSRWRAPTVRPGD